MSIQLYSNLNTLSYHGITSFNNYVTSSELRFASFLPALQFG